MGFTLTLIAICLVSGITWLLGRAQRQNFSREPVWHDLGRTVFLVVAAILLVRSFAIEPYRIPSESMLPTLHKGDFIFVHKFKYGLRLPVVNTLVMTTGKPHLGDVIVFRKPTDETINYIKRVVGLPGDRLSYRDGILSVNGVVQNQRPREDNGDAYSNSLTLGVESLGVVEHDVLHQKRPHPDTIRNFERTVPADHYFVMGDNRDDSQDSRYSQIGFVPFSNLVGKASRIWFNSNNWDRVGTAIK